MLSENAIQGYAYQESITGEKAEDIQARRLEEIGLSYYSDMLRMKQQTLFKKIEQLDVAEVEVAVAPLVAVREAKIESEKLAAEEAIADQEKEVRPEEVK
jgi:hypothetical protein